MSDERSSPNSSNQMRGWFKLIETIRQTDPPLTSPEKICSSERAEAYSNDENDDDDDDSTPPESPAKKRITIRKSNRKKIMSSIPCGTELDELPGNEERDERFLHYFDLNTLSLHFNTCLYIEKRTSAYPKQQIFKSRHNVLKKIFRIDYLKTINSPNDSSIDSSPTAQSFRKDWSSNRHRSSRKNFFHQLQLNPKRTLFDTSSTSSVSSSTTFKVNVERMKDILLRTYYPSLCYRLEHENHFGAKAKFSSDIIHRKQSAPIIERRVSEEIPVSENREKRPLIDDDDDTNKNEPIKKIRTAESTDDDDDEENELPDQQPQPLIVTNGLRSNFYKNESISLKHRSLRKRTDHLSARLPPIYSGLFGDYRLPYDIYWHWHWHQKKSHRNKTKKVPSSNSFVLIDEKTFVQTSRLFLWRNWKKSEEKKLPLVFPQNFYHRKSLTKRKQFDCLSSSDFLRLFFAHLRRSHFARTGRCRSELIDEYSIYAQFAQFSYLLNEMFEAILNFKCPSSDIVPSNALKHCPDQILFPLYYEMIVEPIDLSIIRKKLQSNKYRNFEAFDADLLLLFSNAINYCGDDSEVGQAVKQLKDFYSFELKLSFLKSFSLFDRKNFIEFVKTSSNEFEEFVERLHRRETFDGIIRQCLYEMIFEIDSNVPTKISKEILLHCRCGSVFEETILVQCYACQLWQHASCVTIIDSYRPYFCFECDPLCEENASLCRKMNVRIPLANSSNSFSTLTRDDGFIIRINETYRLSSTSKEIFFVERLFIDENQIENAQGFFYRRPEEISMEKNSSQRKYFPNELIRCQFHQDIRSIKTFDRPCYILDLSTYIKGRPMSEFTSELNRDDLFICEYRLDKSGKTLTKLVKGKQTSVNTKSFCFDSYLEKLIMKRDQKQFLDDECPRRHVIRHRLLSKKTRSERCAHLNDLISKFFSSQLSKCS